MKNDFLADVLGNSLRARVLRVMAHSTEIPLSVIDIAKRSASTSRAVSRELLNLLKSHIVTKTITLSSTTKGGREQKWGLNAKSPHMMSLVHFIHTVAPVRHERIVETLKKAGKISTVIIAGSFLGDPSRQVDLVVAVEHVNESQVDRAVRALENEWGREVRYSVFPTSELRYRLTVQDKLLRDVLDFPHKVLLDKGDIVARG